MKPNQTKTGTLSALRSFTTKTLQVITIAVFTVIMYTNTYANDNNSNNTNFLESINLKGYSENQSDFLQWEVSNPSAVAYFTIVSSKNTDMQFNDVASVHPMECADQSKNATFNYKCQSSTEQEVVYYKVRVTFQDNHTMESDFIGINKLQQSASLNISEIKNQGGLITLTFKSPKNQSLTLNILNKAGRLLEANNIVAMEGTNTYSYNTGNISSNEMLIFSLNNQDEQITKKFMLASAW